ncbi:hypothetical protein MMC21_008477 [Puttea exsequens]|nr:hypothetical protein [Puttea exsequens]
MRSLYSCISILACLQWLIHYTRAAPAVPGDLSGAISEIAQVILKQPSSTWTTSASTETGIPGILLTPPEFCTVSTATGSVVTGVGTKADSCATATGTVSPLETGAAGSFCSPENWNATVENWKDANVDENLKTWFLDLDDSAPTGTLVPGSYPTAMPRINTGYGRINGVQGAVGQFISIAAGGKQINCQLIPAGENGQCPSPPSIQEACPNMPRWVYLAWQAIWNMFNVHYAITGILVSEEAYQLGQSIEVIQTFTLQNHAEQVLAIFLAVLGAIVGIIGIGFGLAGIGAAAISQMAAKDIAAAAAKGGLGIRKSPTDAEPAIVVPVSPGQGFPKPKPDENGDTIEPVSPATPPAGAKPPNNQGDGGDPGTHPIMTKPDGKNPKISDPGFIGAVGWSAPGTIISTANGIWQQVGKAPDAATKAALNGAAVTEYMTNQSMIMQDYNDFLLTADFEDTNNTNALLDVLKGGTFAETVWSRYIYEIALSADVISREINAIWNGGRGYFVYVSYTNLNDPDGTKCNSTRVGVVATQVCADGGVYYLQSLQFPLAEPSGWSSIQNFGILPWWPTSGARNAYNALNPSDRNKEPPVISPADDHAFTEFIKQFVSANTYDMLALLGQAPGEWTLPVCDQGLNYWTYDWSHASGDAAGLSISHYSPTPCACGHKGTGTKAFYDALGADDNLLGKVQAACEENLLNIDPALEKKEENIGWNAISGGKPDNVVYGDGHTLTAPGSVPTQLCYLVDGDCRNTNYPVKPCAHKDC